MEQLNEVISETSIIQKMHEEFRKNPIKFKKMCEVKLSQDYIKTENFGWVWKKDYEKHEFLRRDKGIPCCERPENTTSEEYIEDLHGNKRKQKIIKQKMITVVSPEYFEWQEDIKKRHICDEEEIRLQELISDPALYADIKNEITI